MEEDQSWIFKESSEYGKASLSGELDFTTTQSLRAELMAYLAKGEADMKLDLSNLAYIDSSGISLLIEIRKTLQRQQRSLKISSASDQVMKILKLTQMNGLFGL